MKRLSHEQLERTLLGGNHPIAYIERPEELFLLMEYIASPGFSSKLLYGAMLKVMKDWLIGHPEFELTDYRIDESQMDKARVYWGRIVDNASEKMQTDRRFRRFQKQFSELDKKLSGKKKRAFRLISVSLGQIAQQAVSFLPVEEKPDVCSLILDIIEDHMSVIKEIIIYGPLDFLLTDKTGFEASPAERNSLFCTVMAFLIAGRIRQTVEEEETILNSLAKLLKSDDPSRMFELQKRFEDSEEPYQRIFQELLDVQKGDKLSAASEDLSELQKDELDDVWQDSKPEDLSDSSSELEELLSSLDKTDDPFWMPGMSVDYEGEDDLADLPLALFDTPKTDGFRMQRMVRLIGDLAAEGRLKHGNDQAGRLSDFLTIQAAQASQLYTGDLDDLDLPGFREFAGSLMDLYKRYYRNTGYPENPVLAISYLFRERLREPAEFEQYTLLEQFTALFAEDGRWFRNYIELRKSGAEADESFISETMMTFGLFVRFAIDLLYTGRPGSTLDADFRDSLLGFYRELNPSKNDREDQILLHRMFSEFISESGSYTTSEEFRMVETLFALFTTRLSQKDKKRLFHLSLSKLNRSARSFAQAVMTFMRRYDRPGIIYADHEEFRHDAAILFLAALILDPFHLAGSTPYWIAFFNDSADNDLASSFVFDREISLKNRAAQNCKNEQWPEKTETVDLTDQEQDNYEQLNRIVTVDDENWDEDTVNAVLLSALMKSCGAFFLNTFEYGVNQFEGVRSHRAELNQFLREVRCRDESAKIWDQTPKEIQRLLLLMITDRIELRNRMKQSRPTSIFDRENIQNTMADYRSRISLLEEQLLIQKEENLRTEGKSGTEADLEAVSTSAYQKGYKSAQDEFAGRNRELKKQVEAFEKEKKQWQAERKELAKLRTMMFEQNTETIQDNPAISGQEEKKLRGFFSRNEVILVGGHDQLVRALGNKYGISRVYMSETQNTDVFVQADAAFIMPKFMNHSLYNKAMSAIERNDIEVLYINNKNLEVAERTILEFISRQETQTS